MTSRASAGRWLMREEKEEEEEKQEEVHDDARWRTRSL